MVFFFTNPSKMLISDKISPCAKLTFIYILWKSNDANLIRQTAYDEPTMQKHHPSPELKGLIIEIASRLENINLIVKTYMNKSKRHYER